MNGPGNEIYLHATDIMSLLGDEGGIQMKKAIYSDVGLLASCFNPLLSFTQKRLIPVNLEGI